MVLALKYSSGSNGIGILDDPPCVFEKSFKLSASNLVVLSNVQEMLPLYCEDPVLTRPLFVRARVPKVVVESMEVFDEHAKARISVASKTFLVQKLKQAMFTTLSAVCAAVLFWCLSIFSV